VDIFDKCYSYTKADEAKKQGIYPYFHALESRQDVEVIMEGKRRIMLGSNNYSGADDAPGYHRGRHPAFEKYGSGCSGSRFLNGTLEMHLELEDELAAFVGKDSAVTFSTGFQSNLGIISAVVGRGDYVICDRENHASIYDGCRLSFGKMVRFQHADMDDLERVLQHIPEDAGKLIVTDGVFSMGGDIANLPEIVTLAKKYGARTMVDDAQGWA
jgi:7-keto-8-aminopelargonate synthetase-like enzyme